ncbi:uncharacterized protein [Montipora capricornis]|uniref:uncharacterized protein isoform X2 n=1 Tax=Montipora capricornis TaxID=246305 RepID=UPI0035F14278
MCGEYSQLHFSYGSGFAAGNSATQAALATPTAGQQQQMPLNSRNTGQQQRTAVSTPAAENARAELGRLFNFTPAGIPRKRKLPTGIKLPNTWTHTFICLGRMRDNEVPSNGYKTQLSNASLGEKKITFEKKSSCNHFHEKLLESYPKLKEGGGYELMRTKFRSTSKLEILQPKGNAGHNVLDLKEMVASARIYVRPLQNDLSLEQIEHASLSSDTGPLEMCVKCGIRIQLSTMRQHMQDCGGGSVASTSSVYDPDMLDFSGTSQVTTIVNDHSSDEDKDPVPIKTGCQQKSAVSPTALADLQGIFPVKSSSALQSALDIGGSLEQAIDLLLETGMPSVCTQPRTAVEIMQSYRCQTEKGTAYIDVNRMQLSMPRQIMTIYKNPQLNLKKHVNVNFHGEQGADLGGPSKEFFHSAISSLSKVDPVFNMQLFGGQDGHLIPFYGVDAVSSGCFQVAGKLVAHSLKNDGPGFVGLSPAVVKYLNTGSLEEAAVFVTMDDLTDLELKGLLQEKMTTLDTH